jgi:hypothetical protein
MEGVRGSNPLRSTKKISVRLWRAFKYMTQETLWQRQIIPVVLTVLVAAVLILILHFEISVLNSVLHTDISLHWRWGDILIGATIYLKTAIDFAIFIARLMDSNRGWKSRIAIEIGTAAGNAAGTMLILLVWSLFHEVTWLLALMIFIAALVLFRLAQEGLEHVSESTLHQHQIMGRLIKAFDRLLQIVNVITEPLLRYVVPNFKVKQKANLTFWGLFGFAFLVPFILGLDDFAGYVPLFNIVNVFGFAIGVFLGHMVLNALLYISPERTIKVIKNPVISLLGSVAFVGLGVWGLIEVVRLLFP